MAITSDDELESKVQEASALLQEIQDYVKRDFTKAAKVRFPRGFLRTAAEARERLPFLERSHFKSNVSYALMLSDVQHWLLARTDISGTAKEMVIKLQIFLLGTVVESITKVYLRGRCGGNYKRRTEFLVEKQLISPEVKVELDWLWDMRNRMHLFQVEEHEWLSTEYSAANHNRAVRSFKALTDAFIVADTHA
jgi:hypothetical protein